MSGGAPGLVEGFAETRGQAAERRVHDTVRAALPPDYVGLTRATMQLVVIAPPELARRLAKMSV